MNWRSPNNMVNFSLLFIKRWREDPVAMDLYALYIFIKIVQCDSKIRFRSQRELLRKLKIGHEKWKEIKAHPLFEELFRINEDFLVASRHRFNGVQLSISLGKPKKKPKDRIIVRINKKELNKLNYKRVLDKMLEAVFINCVRGIEHGIDGSVPKSRPEVPKGISGLPFAGIIDSTISNKSVSRLLLRGITKTKKLINMAVKDDRAVKKFKNAKYVTTTDDPIEWIEAHKHEYKIGRLIPSGNAVLWQIPNSYRLVNRKAKNKCYFGYFSAGYTKEEKSKEGPLRKDDFGFFSIGSNKKIMKFLNAVYVSDIDGVIVGISPKDKMAKNNRLIAIDWAMRDAGPLWDSMKKDVQKECIRRRMVALRFQEIVEKVNKYIRPLKKAYDDVESWDEATYSKAEKELSIAKEEAAKAGTNIDNVYARIKRRMDKHSKTKKEHISFVQMRDIYAKEAGELEQAVMALTPEAIAMHRKEKLEIWMDEHDQRNGFGPNEEFAKSNKNCNKRRSSEKSSHDDISEDNKEEREILNQNTTPSEENIPFWNAGTDEPDLYDDDDECDDNTYSSFVLPDYIPGAVIVTGKEKESLLSYIDDEDTTPSDSNDHVSNNTYHTNYYVSNEGKINDTYNMEDEDDEWIEEDYEDEWINPNGSSNLSSIYTTNNVEGMRCNERGSSLSQEIKASSCGLF